jgi:simple sugar transport system permease protein
VLSVLLGLALAGVIMKVSGYAVQDAYGALWTGATGLETGPARAGQVALGGMHLNLYLIAQSLAKMTPLLFVGLAIALALRAGLFNIGAQGQMTCGALAAGVAGLWQGIPTVVHIPLILLFGTLAGALWGALAAWFKATRGVHEVLSTIMLNYVAVNVATYLTTHNLKDPMQQAAQTASIPRSLWLAPLVPGSNLTVGLFLALLCAVLVAVLISRTASGFRIRTMGLGMAAGRAAGIPVTRTLVMTLAISGGLAGLAGAVEVLGVQHRYLQGIAANYGFDGIAVALLGGLSAPAVVLSALFFGSLASGSAYMQLQTDVPDSIAVIVQAMVILFIGMRTLGRASRTVSSIAPMVGVISPSPPLQEPDPRERPPADDPSAQDHEEAKHVPL